MHVSRIYRLLRLITLLQSGRAHGVRQLMEEQHNGILKEIADGKLDHYLTPEERRSGPDKG